ncbi:MAG: hypothetical protein NTW60_01945 [Candidatus Wolfebacteria bacterium]|nr:hypothetical protein [Candidatus Wolfebacteria bacterium]
MVKRKNKNKISGKITIESLVYLFMASILIFLFGCFTWMLWMMTIIGENIHYIKGVVRS